MVRPVTSAALTLLTLLTACGSGEQEPVEAQRFSLEAARRMPPEPLLSPDTKAAGWTVTADGQAIDFGLTGEKPMMTLACDLRAAPARLLVIRHVTGRPGAKALFPVIGNGTISRFKLDAALRGGEWRWEGALPASDPSLDVFTGPNALEATLPGGGSLQIAGSRIPGEFINWCRAGGRVQRAEAAEKASDAKATAQPSSARPAR